MPKILRDMSLLPSYNTIYIAKLWLTQIGTYKTMYSYTYVLYVSTMKVVRTLMLLPFLSLRFLTKN